MPTVDHTNIVERDTATREKKNPGAKWLHKRKSHRERRHINDMSNTYKRNIHTYSITIGWYATTQRNMDAFAQNSCWTIN